MGETISTSCQELHSTQHNNDCTPTRWAHITHGLGFIELLGGAPRLSDRCQFCPEHFGLYTCNSSPQVNSSMRYALHPSKQVVGRSQVHKHSAARWELAQAQGDVGGRGLILVTA